MLGEFIGRVPDRPPLREQFKLACGLAYVMITRLVSRSTVIAVPVFLLVCVHENVVLWAGHPRSHSGRIAGVAWSGFCILKSCLR